MKTAELEGAALDAAVALAEGFASFWIDPGDESRGESCVLGPARAEDSRFDWCPSSTWEQGGPIIERECIQIGGYGTSRQAEIRDDAKPWVNMWGETILIAAMRAFVASRLGEDVELP